MTGASAPEYGLDGIEIFAHLDARQTSSLIARLQSLSLRRGEVLMRQGEPADALYIVVSGRFAVTRNGRQTPVAEIGPNQPIGEIGFLTGGKRTATVSAMRDSLVLRLDRTAFDELINEHPAVLRGLTATLAGRLAETTAAAKPPPDPRPRTIAIIRAGSGTIPPVFFERFKRVFGAHGRTLFLDAEMARNRLGDLGSAEATRRLNALEREYDYVVFFADDERTVWSEKAIRHADIAIAVARHSADAKLSPLEELAGELLPADARRLVLLHAYRSRVSSTARWLERRHVAMHHHVALDDDSDMERLFRFVSGTARGLIACGGGAFCAAHVGLYKALRECEVEFDIMGGTSAGSAMTAAFTLSGEPEQIDAAIHDMFVANRAMRRYTLPRYSILDHSNFDAQLQHHYGGIDIEDLWLPFFAVSTNLSRYTTHIHRSGSLWTAIRASASIPVLLPPFYTRDGEMLVDGCLLDNVPIRTMHDLKSGPNVVISFNLPELERFNVDYETLPSRGELIRLALNPMRRALLPDAPGLTTVLMRSLMANRHNFQSHLGRDDLLLVPPIPADMGFLDWHRHSELFACGYSWALEEISRHQAQGHPALVTTRAAAADG